MKRLPAPLKVKVPLPEKFVPMLRVPVEVIVNLLPLLRVRLPDTVKVPVLIDVLSLYLLLVVLPIVNEPLIVTD
jgi:hypothetical protein